MGETHRPYTRLRRAQNTISILAHKQAGRHMVYPGHYPRIFIAPKNAPKAETKHWSGAVPILLLVIPASMTSTYSSLNVLQESNPQPQLLKALVYHSATSAVHRWVWRMTQESFSNFLDIIGGNFIVLQRMYLGHKGDFHWTPQKFLCLKIGMTN